MKRAVQPTPAADPARKQAVIYARVSSKEQEKEGFSIPAQLKLLKEYAAANGFTIAQEYVDVETAKQTGRAAFGEMIAYLMDVVERLGMDSGFGQQVTDEGATPIIAVDEDSPYAFAHSA